MAKFHFFTTDVTTIPLPSTIDFPYNYMPHQLAAIAATELQTYLERQTDFTHDFGIKNPNSSQGLGKMFGVLVVKKSQGKLGYLAAFSGKLAEATQHTHFVPPVFDVLAEDGFYKTTENELNAINTEITLLENDASFLACKETFLVTKKKYTQLLNTEKQGIKERQQIRKQVYKAKKKTLSGKELTAYQEQINQLKINETFYLREYESYLTDKLNPAKTLVEEFQAKINDLKQLRAEKSAWVQQEIFKHYSFLNKEKNIKNLLDIFKGENQNIPAGAGDCCAPKLFQYAFKNEYTPICMAEFWWGKPLNTAVRKHQYFYPACLGKCKPILTHMLVGLNVANNPLFEELKTAKKLEIIYEDDALLVVNKPTELLSVPGKEITDSVYTRIKKKYPTATRPLLVHRLDMSTSGILIVAKNKEAHKTLQEQFINKTVKKRYVAVLDGILTEKKGTISLPLALDYYHRPKQLVCFTDGKEAVTHWEVLEVTNQQTKVHLYPITGRTHQLRMHAAHHLGLNTSIVGDDLYGKKANRLHLHAEQIEFVHPTTNLPVKFSVKAFF